MAPAAVSDRESALESIGVDIVIERIASRPLPEPGGAPGREDDSRATISSADLAARESEEPPAAAAEVAPETTAPPAPESDRPVAPDETEAAPQVAERIAMPGIVTTTAAPQPSAPVDPADDDRKTSPDTDRKALATAPLSPAAAGGGRASAYLSSVFETLRSRPPRPYAGPRRTVFVRFVIGRDGNVATIEVRRSSGSTEVDESARDFIRRTRFPAPPADVPAKDLDVGIELTFG
ncbi:MAG: TonB family protein [Hyphomicrobiaceae bacterium]